MLVMAIDPGPERSGYCCFLVDGNEPEPPYGIKVVGCSECYGHAQNGFVAEMVAKWPELLVIESIRGVYGGSTGSDQIAGERVGGIFAGIHLKRFGFVGLGVLGDPAPGTPVAFVPAATARTAILGKSNAKDSQVRAALIDIFGGHDAVYGVRCGPCSGRGSTRRVECQFCEGSGWKIQPSVMAAWKGDGAVHIWDALAVGVSCFVPGYRRW